MVDSQQSYLMSFAIAPTISHTNFIDSEPCLVFCRPLETATIREIRSAEVDISVGCAKVGHSASWQLGDPQLR
jgi:hypothetical protein